MQSLPSPISETSFLGLPYFLRRRIIVSPGLVRFCHINFNQEGINIYKYQGKHSLKNACFYKARQFYGRDFGKDFIYRCSCTPLPISLLYVSRVISDEVSSILYSQNTFIISPSDSWGLWLLCNPSSKALQLLQSLTLRLNNCSCVFDYEWFTIPAVHPCHPLCQSHGRHGRLLGNVARQDRAVLDGWQNIVNILAANVHCQSLHLSFVHKYIYPTVTVAARVYGVQQSNLYGCTLYHHYHHQNSNRTHAQESQMNLTPSQERAVIK